MGRAWPHRVRSDWTLRPLAGAAMIRKAKIGVTVIFDDEEADPDFFEALARFCASTRRLGGHTR